MTSAEKFEILSAYLDDEASQEERHLVEHWIKCDPLFRHQYQVQLALKSAVRSLPADFFDVEIAIETRPASDRPFSEHPSSEQPPFEQRAQPEDFDKPKPDRFSIHTEPSIGEANGSSSIDGISAQSTYWSDTQRKPTTASCTASTFRWKALRWRALRWKALLVVAAALFAAAFTTFSSGSIQSSQGGKIRRTSERITKIDVSLQKKQLIVFSAQ